MGMLCSVLCFFGFFGALLIVNRLNLYWLHTNRLMIRFSVDFAIRFVKRLCAVELISI